MSDLDGRVAVVTGASRGIGLAIAQVLVGAGATTWMLARSAERLEAASVRLGSIAHPLVCDVTDETMVAASIERIVNESGGIDILVNNAGVFPLAPFAETSVSDFRDSLAANLLAPFALARHVLGHMVTRNSGDIVSIGSVADRTAFPGNAAYAASKFGARAMHEVLRAETRGTGVRAALVSPSPVDTPIWDPIDPDNRKGFPPRSAMLQPRDVADAVLYVLTRPRTVNIDELRLSHS